MAHITYVHVLCETEVSRTVLILPRMVNDDIDC